MKNKFLIFASLILCIASVFSFALIPKSSASAEEIIFNNGDVVSISSGAEITFIPDTSANYFGYFSLSLVINSDLLNYLQSNKNIISITGLTINDTFLDIKYDVNFTYNSETSVSNISDFEYNCTTNLFGTCVLNFRYSGNVFTFINNTESDIVSSTLKSTSNLFTNYFNVDSCTFLVDNNEYTFTPNFTPLFSDCNFEINNTLIYNVTFNDYQGNNINSQSIQENTTCIVPNAPVREGYEFIGWTSSVDGVGVTSPITQDVTFTATYKLKTYDVVIKDWDGSVLQSYSVNHGDTYTTDYIPTRTGYTFTGYTSDNGYELGGIVTNDIVLTATYSINQYNVVFLGNGNTTIKSITCDYGTYLNVPTPPTIVGYTFSHWESSVDGVTTTSAVTQDVTFTAKYALNVYVVKFIDENGVIENTLNINHGEIVSVEDIPTTDKPGYKFLGWKSSVDTLSIDSQILTDVTFSKQYKIIQEFWDGVEYAGNTNYGKGYSDGQASIDTDIIYDNGYDKGYSDGYDVGLGQDNTYLLSDLFFGILDAPFNVIANVFDFEIFGIDIGNFFIVLISFLLIGWVIKRLL